MEHPAENEVTRLLDAAQAGAKDAARDLLPLVYDELRKLARFRLGRLPAGQTLQATALVHEAYMRLVGHEDPRWDSRGHFFAAAAQAMRNIMVERARRRGRYKHGAGRRRVELDGAAITLAESNADVLAIDEALVKLEQQDERKGRIVMLRFFAGLAMEEIAELLGVSTRTVEREWRFARAWLSREMAGEVGPAGEEDA
jgi:RNA polymerase sigma factor (TIGR02999 family)